MTAYDVTVSGCDDSTRVFDLELSDVEAAALSRVAGAVNEASTESCQPTLILAVAARRPDSGLCNECFDLFEVTDQVTRDRYGEWIHHACLGGAA